jgi:hypothetical protein
VALLAGCALGWYGRYFVIEPEHLHALCSASAAGLLCTARAALIDLTFRGSYGLSAVGPAVLVWVLRGRAAVVVAGLGLFAGGLGLHLYDTGWAAAGVLGILLRLPRIGQEADAPRDFTA